MNFTISVYQQKGAGDLVWTTLGLGDHNLARRGKSPTKIQRAIGDVLKKAIRKMRPADAARLELVRGRQLKRVHLDIAASDGRASGRFPLVLEPRVCAPGKSLMLVYHPFRQDDFFVLPEEHRLEELANRHLGWAWRHLSSEYVRAMTSDGRDALRAFSFVERGPRLIDELPNEDDPWADLEIELEREKRGKKKRKKKHGRKQLRALGVNVTARVADAIENVGRPREPWRTQLVQLLCATQKTPIVLVGPPGVGKSTLLARWVMDLLESDDYFAHRNLDRVSEVWRIAARRILAGMSFVGDWEQRCVDLVHEASDPRVVLWVEDLHTFGRAGRTRDSDRTLADVFRGPLARGEITMVGECTEAEWHRLEEDAPSFADRFTVLRVTPASAEETFRLMLHEARRFERISPVRFAPDAYRAVAQLGESLYPGSARPGVDVDLLRRLADEARASDDTQIGASEVVSFLARRTGLPEALLRPDSEIRPEELAESFTRHVLGQPEAIRAAVDLIARIRAGLTDRDRPFATYLFTGPTGTGKTQMARAIAGFLYGDESTLIRFDMGELSGPDAVPRLIGDRYDPRGLLTDAVRERPFSVVLLDEIEKAHPSVLALLLSLLDEGRLTDAGGQLADFRRAVIVMTSNLGARPRAAIGFGESADAVLRDVDRAVREFFPAELFNRIDRIVAFRPLAPEVAERVTEKELAQLLARRGLTDRGVFVFASPEAVRRMAEEAFDARDGARSVKRYLEAELGSLLTDELANANRARMRIVRVHAVDGSLRLHVDALTEAIPLLLRYELEGLLDAPLSALRNELPRILHRVTALEASGAYREVRERMSSLVERIGRGDRSVERTLYHLDAFRDALTELRAHLEHRTDERLDVELELRHERRKELVERGAYRYPTRSVRVLDRRALSPEMGSLDRTEIVRSIAEIAFLERAVHRLPDPGEHRVLLELLRVGQGRSAPSYERTPEGFFEWLVRFYASLRGEVIGAAARDERDRIEVFEEPVDLDALIARRPLQVVFEIVGLGVRSYLESEVGCHLWTSLLSGSSIVRVRLLDADDETSAKSAIERHLAMARAFEGALDRGEDLPPDPAQLLPAVRSIRFDPPERPGETSLVTLEDYSTGQVRAAHARTIAEALTPIVWLHASRIEEAP